MPGTQTRAHGHTDTRTHGRNIGTPLSLSLDLCPRETGISTMEYIRSLAR